MAEETRVTHVGADPAPVHVNPSRNHRRLTQESEFVELATKTERAKLEYTRAVDAIASAEQSLTRAKDQADRAKEKLEDMLSEMKRQVEEMGA